MSAIPATALPDRPDKLRSSTTDARILLNSSAPAVTTRTGTAPQTPLPTYIRALIVHPNPVASLSLEVMFRSLGIGADCVASVSAARMRVTRCGGYDIVFVDPAVDVVALRRLRDAIAGVDAQVLLLSQPGNRSIELEGIVVLPSPLTIDALDECLTGSGLRPELSLL